MDIKSQITFLYFEDLRKAVEFFEHSLKFERVCNQGHCIIWRTSQSSFIGAVDIKRGSVGGKCKESVLTCFVVENVERAYSLLGSTGISLLTDVRKNQDSGVHSFLLEGPEGYRFEVQEFKDEEYKIKFGSGNFACGSVGAVSQITFLYFKSMAVARDYFDNTMKFESACEQGYCKMWRTSKTSFIGAVDESVLSFGISGKDGVLTSFVVEDSEAAHGYLQSLNLDRLTEIKFNKSSDIKSCMFYGPEGYRFESEEFMGRAHRGWFTLS